MNTISLNGIADMPAVKRGQWWFVAPEALAVGAGMLACEVVELAADVTDDGQCEIDGEGRLWIREDLAHAVARGGPWARELNVRQILGIRKPLSTADMCGAQQA